MRISVKVVTRAHCNQVEKIDEFHYIVRTTIVPEKGNANTQIVKLLAKHFNISQNSVNIIRGSTARHKIITIS